MHAVPSAEADANTTLLARLQATWYTGPAWPK